MGLPVGWFVQLVLARTDLVWGIVSRTLIPCFLLEKRDISIFHSLEIFCSRPTTTLMSMAVTDSVAYCVDPKSQLPSDPKSQLPNPVDVIFKKIVGGWTRDWQGEG